jgi:hypothetical protein
VAFRAFALRRFVAAVARTLFAIQIGIVVAELSRRFGKVSIAGFQQHLAVYKEDEKLVVAMRAMRTKKISQTCVEERHAVFRVRQINRAELRLGVAAAGAVTFVALVTVWWENFFITVVRVVTCLAIIARARLAFR